MSDCLGGTAVPPLRGVFDLTAGCLTAGQAFRPGGRVTEAPVGAGRHYRETAPG
jgi:hypothetical protein